MSAIRWRFAFALLGVDYRSALPGCCAPMRSGLRVTYRDDAYRLSA